MQRIQPATQQTSWPLTCHMRAPSPSA